MALEWMPREHELKNHLLFEEDMVQGRYWGTDDDAPCVVYTKKPLVNPFTGEEVPDLYVAEVRLNNPRQYNSYTTTMVKGVIAGFRAASGDRSVVATVFTGTGFDAFCTGGNTKEYSEYYSRRPNEYGEYMDLFNEMVDSILMCKKPTICRVNGMRVAGGQEIGMACDLAITSGPGHLRPGRRAPRLGPGRRLHRLPALDAQHGRRHVELRFLRNVVGLQDEGPRTWYPRWCRS
jgi:6-oxo-cyclohex-1-ene-carbonyl-CoA hydrolase